MRRTPPLFRRWRLWVRDAVLALVGGAAGFGAVYVAVVPDRAREAMVAPAVPIPRPAPAGTPPDRAAGPSAFVAVAPLPPPAAARRHRPYRRTVRHPSRASAQRAALARDYAADALITRQLNAAGLARLKADERNR